jgi:predicted nucleic acid-binding protein
VSSVLVDTSVWRGYFSGRAAPHAVRAMDAMLDEDGALLVHPAIIGELVLGGLSTREELLLRRLPAAAEVSSTELLAFVRYRQLQRRGVGWVDCQLLASAILASACLWSLDRKLAAAAAKLEIAFAEASFG